MKFKCPYCGNKTFSIWHKIIAGGMTAKGVKCPECGRHAVHGLKSTIFKSVVMAVTLVLLMINAVMIYAGTAVFTDVQCIVMFAVVYVVFCKLINGIVFDLAENNRKDIK